MTWVAVGVIAVGAVAGGAMQADAAKSAAGTQAGALNNATQSQQQMFNAQQQQQQPYRQTGYTALGQIATGFGTANTADGSGPLTEGQVQQIYQRYMGRPVQPDELQSIMAGNTSAAQLEQSVAQSPESSFHQNTQKNVNPITSPLFSSGPTGGDVGGISQGQFTHQFDANDLKTNLAPNYDFMLSQGQGAVKNMANMGGGVFSGNTLKAINDYTQNYAGNAYQQAYQNYNTNQTNIYNRLASIAGLGQTAGSNSTTGGSAYSSGIAGSTAAAGAAQAGGQIGSANALAQGGNNAMGWYAMSNMNQPATQPMATNQQWIEQPQ